MLTHTITMKAAQERNQECLPPKKRDLPVSSSSCSGAGVTAGPERGGGGGGGGSGGGTTGGASTSTVGEDDAVSIQTAVASSDTQGGTTPAEWVRAQPGLHYSVDNAEGVPAVPVDQYSMLYKVALPSVTYSPNSPHPVLSHISSAYTVHSPLLQHPGLPYPPLGYAQIPHSSVQFVSPSYAAVPYALPPGFVPGSLISPSGTISQPHAVSHIVPYPPVIQEGVVSPPPQPQVAAHTFAKVGASAGAIPLMLPSEQAAQQHLGAVGVLSAKEGLPVYYQAQGASAVRDPHGGQQENEPEVNGRDKAQGTRELALDSTYVGKNVRQLQATQEHSQDRGPHNRWLDGRSSPERPGTPDSDLEVQQVVGRLASSHQPASGGRKEVCFAAPGAPQSAGRSRELQAEGVIASRPAYAGQSVGYSDPRTVASLQQQAVVLANGQPLLVPLDHPTQQQQYAGLTNDTSARVCLPEKEPQQQPPSNPSHFMKGAIIQLATGELKRVEDLQTQDFVRSAEASGGLKIDSSMVVDVRPSRQRAGLVSLHFTVGEQQSRVAIDVPPEHPFFVFGQGWSSCSPERTAQLYGLACHHLQAGDVCVSVTLQQPPQPQPQQQQQQQQQPQQQPQLLPRTLVKSSVTSAPVHQLMGPPAPQQPRPQSLSLPRPERSPRERVDRDGGIKDVASHLGPLGLSESPAGRPSRTSVEHPRSQSSYHLHTHGAALEGAGSATGAQRRWSSPGLQRYGAKGEEGTRVSMSSSAHRRPSFIPQEVKLSIEGRSNAGK